MLKPNIEQIRYLKEEKQNKACKLTNTFPQSHRHYKYQSSVELSILKTMPKNPHLSLEVRPSHSLLDNT